MLIMVQGGADKILELIRSPLLEGNFSEDFFTEWHSAVFYIFDNKSLDCAGNALACSRSTCSHACI